MLAQDFMVPATSCAVCGPNSEIGTVAKIMSLGKVGSVVIVDEGVAKGIVTKSDIVDAYVRQLPFTAPISELGIATPRHAGLSPPPTLASLHSRQATCHQQLVTVTPLASRDQVACVMFQNKLHHVIVTDHDGKFKGLISSWDVAKEVSLDASSWPWIRGTQEEFLSRAQLEKSSFGRQGTCHE